MLNLTQWVSLLALCALVVSCASGPNPNRQRDASLSGQVKECRSGDAAITSASQCIADDAACYQLADASWCTGARNEQCPAGSTELPGGAPCPPGARCFAHSESRRCSIGFN